MTDNSVSKGTQGSVLEKDKVLKRSDSLPRLESFWKPKESGEDIEGAFRRSMKTARSPSSTLALEKSGKRGKTEDEAMETGIDETKDKEKKRPDVKDIDGEEKDESVMGMLREILKEIRGNKREMDVKLQKLNEKIDIEKQERASERHEWEEWKDKFEKEFERRFRQMDESTSRPTSMNLHGVVDSIHSSDKEDETLKVDNDKKKGAEDQRNKMEEDLKTLRDKVADLENRSRRGNIVFAGIEDKDGERGQETEEKVQNILKDQLGLQDVAFIRIHRVGVYSDGRKRVVVGKLSDERDKERIWKNKGKLKGSQIFIDEDFGKKTREAREKLRIFGRELQKEGKGRYALVVDVLKCGGKQFRYDETSDKVVEFSKKEMIREM